MSSTDFEYWRHPVCKFFRFSSYTNDIFDNLRLHLSSPVSFNDPFEGLNEELPFLQHDTVVTCFSGLRRQDGSTSNTLFNPVMWSHYADMHRGFCLVFDPLVAALFPVRYKRERPRGFSYHDTITCKGDAWAYENEYRFIGTKTPSELGRIEYDRGEYYLKFYPDDIKAVIFGCRADEGNVSRMMSYVFAYAMRNEEGERPLRSLAIKSLSLMPDRFELTAANSFIFAKTNDPEGRRSPQWTILPDLKGHGDEEGSIHDLLRISPLNKPSTRPETPDRMIYSKA